MSPFCDTHENFEALNAVCTALWLAEQNREHESMMLADIQQYIPVPTGAPYGPGNLMDALVQLRTDGYVDFGSFNEIRLKASFWDLPTHSGTGFKLDSYALNSLAQAA